MLGEPVAREAESVGGLREGDGCRDRGRRRLTAAHGHEIQDRETWRERHPSSQPDRSGAYSGRDGTGDNPEPIGGILLIPGRCSPNWMEPVVSAPGHPGGRRNELHPPPGPRPPYLRKDHQ
ncbi:hypothetical protein GCM10010932_12530 [Agromyces flavus]|nr:hypothetical protein GCM10010932_12530 [Agromyces flavus]